VLIHGYPLDGNSWERQERVLLPAGYLSGVAPLPQAQKTDIYLTGLGALLTSVYIYGLIFRPHLRLLRMGSTR
jgi:cation:H+ antiporter